MGITWSFSCNIQQGLWKFLESRLGNVNVMYQRYQPNQNQNDQWLHDKWTWGFPKQVIHKTIGPPTKKTQKRHHDIKELVSPAHMYNANLERLYSTLVHIFIIFLFPMRSVQPAMRTWSHWALWPQGFNLRHAPASGSPRPRRTNKSFPAQSLM